MMKLIFAAMASLALSACGLMPLITGIPAAPSELANRSVYDEVGIIALAGTVEVAADLATLAVQNDVIRGEGLNTTRDLSGKARRLLRVAQSAYAAGNSTSYKEAAAELMVIITQMRNLSKGVPVQ